MKPVTNMQLNEIEQLRHQWQSVRKTKAGGGAVIRFSLRRKKELIADIAYTNNQGNINNSHWAYRVPFAFHDALDIRLSKLQKTENKNTRYYSAWTQGCLLSFSKGDFFESNQSAFNLQISTAKPMTWDSNSGIMDEGEVTYQLFTTKGTGKFFTVSQIEFLQLLINGD